MLNLTKFHFNKMLGKQIDTSWYERREKKLKRETPEYLENKNKKFTERKEAKYKAKREALERMRIK